MEQLISLLKKNSAFKDVPETQLRWLLDNGELKSFPEGAKVFVKGDPIMYLIIVVEGSISVKVERNGNFMEVFKVEKGEISGILPYSRAKLATGFGTTEIESQLFLFNKDRFPEMIHTQHELTEALVHVMSDRVRELTKEDMHKEKLIALGKISAGLAHELNNPSSAVVRAAAALKQHLDASNDKLKKVITIQLEENIMDEINHLITSKFGQINSESISLMEKTEMEDEIANWFETHQIDGAYELAPTLVEYNILPIDLEKIIHLTGDQNLMPVLNWIENQLVTKKLLEEIHESSRRISDMVVSIKAYSQMDKAPDKQPADIRKGIESTLIMMGHKLKKKNISVEWDWENVPDIPVYIGELNQVWTNLIDNAIDAMNEGGKLKIVVRKNNNSLEVKIIDNGSGIPQDMQSQIFDPFFSTKKFGEGTGLGLDIVQRIIQKHDAQIKVKSKPGETEFILCFPLT